MAQETTPTETKPTEPAQDGDAGQEPDYKALYENALKESRKWESRSKAFWRSVDLTGNQTPLTNERKTQWFWRGVNLTGNQTETICESMQIARRIRSASTSARSSV